MAHYIEIINFGPVDECSVDVDGLTVLTGPQASGKSTIAKAIYFFRTIKDEIFDLAINPMLLGSFTDNLRHRLLFKFRNIFGIPELNKDARLRYYYNKRNPKSYVDISLANYFAHPFSASVGSEFSQLITEITSQNEWYKEFQTVNLKNMLSQVFNDDYETIYIPSGRSTISLLYKQLPYMLATMEDWQLKDIDYCTRKFIELTLKVRPWFTKNRANKIYESSNPSILEVQQLSQKTLGAKYLYEKNAESLNFIRNNELNSIELNYASSGQQEAVWVFNLLTYYQAEGKKIFSIIEEPEAHLHPEAQYNLIKAITTFCNHTTSQAMITTHSPYVLSSFNNLLYAGKMGKVSQFQAKLQEIIPKTTWLDPDIFNAYIQEDGQTRSIIDSDLSMINLEELDAVAARQDDEYEQMLALSKEVDK